MKYAVMDIEATGLDRYVDQITYIGVGLCEEIGEPIKHYKIYKAPFTGDTLTRFNSLYDKLKERKVKVIWQNGKFDTLFIEHRLNIKLPISHDVMVMGTAHELAEAHGLKEMAQKYLKVPNWDISTKIKTQQSEETEKYLRFDLQYTWEMFCYFHERMQPMHWKAYNEILLPAFKMFRDVEREGIYFDMAAYKKVRELYKKKAAETLEVLKKRYDINWGSSKQVQEVLFKEEKLPTLKLSPKTGAPSADAKVLKRLVARGYELPKLLMEYKFYYGANSKFLNQWEKYAIHDGRIHPNFNITNVVTGRTSCSKPNLQQVPRNPELRTLYTAPPGRVMIEADYSQIELRIAADYANERNMLRIFKEGGDIHTETAKLITGKAEPTKEDRSRSKAVNFGFL